jgi:hypothetical protein
MFLLTRSGFFLVMRFSKSFGGDVQTDTENKAPLATDLPGDLIHEIDWHARVCFERISFEARRLGYRYAINTPGIRNCLLVMAFNEMRKGEARGESFQAA